MENHGHRILQTALKMSWLPRAQNTAWQWEGGAAIVTLKLGNQLPFGECLSLLQTVAKWLAINQGSIVDAWEMVDAGWKDLGTYI